jgi:hypothetical protein
MAKKSTLRALPPAILEQINFILANDQMTIDELTEYLAKVGHEKSRSAVARYSKKWRATTEKIRQTREMTEALVGEIGESAMQGQQGRLLVEMVQSLMFNFMNDEDATAEIQSNNLAQLARGAKELSQALRSNQDFETNIRKQAIADAAASMETTARKRGVDEDIITAIRRVMEGDNGQES